MIEIDVYYIDTFQGKVISYFPYLSEFALKEFNSVGYTGKDFQRKRITREEFLNSLNDGIFKVIKTKSDSGDFCESFMIIHAHIQEK